MPHTDAQPEHEPEGVAAAPAGVDAHTLAVLELPQLLERLASLAMSAPGAARCRRLRPSTDLALVARRQRRLAQLIALMEESDPPGLGGLEDAAPLFKRLHAEGALLEPSELSVVLDFLHAVGRAHSFLAPSQGEMDELFRLANRITPLPELARELSRIIGPGGTVRSAASEELRKVRAELHRARERLQAKLSRMFTSSGADSLFSDQVVTQRGGRYVVPVRTDAKGRLPGIIHDTSQRGATCFVEPLDAIEDNNHLGLLLRRERREVERILAAATRHLATQLQALEEDLAALAQLDCLLAQAELARRLDCSEPILSDRPELELIRARHPLLAWRQAAGRGGAVPIHIRLAPGDEILVISGANAGGKTATLKTAGLVTLMAMCGLQVPCLSGSRVAVWKNVLAEVGDDQSLESELSTFTAHAGRLAAMVRAAGPGSLVLVDELGTGTDPGEGAALAMAVLDWLAEAGARVLCTTHFHRLKAYAAQRQGAVNVSVAFDQGSGQATYQLAYGRAGFSDALAVSKGLGFPPGLIARAEALVEPGERQAAALMKEAEAARQEALAARQEAAEAQASAVADRRQARQELNEARQKRASALAEGKRRVREVSRRLEERLEDLLGRAREAKEQGEEVKPGALRQELYAARRQALVETLQAVAPPEDEPPAAPPRDIYQLEPGDTVRLTHLDQDGVLAEAPRPGMSSVAVTIGQAGVRVQAPLNQIEAAAPAGPARARAKAPAQPRGISVRAQADDGLDLKLIGMRVEDALPKVDKALDQAMLAGRPTMTVVHGVGTGRLRAAVREYLAKHPLVAHAHPGQGPHGGAVTVAELRD